MIIHDKGKRMTHRTAIKHTLNNKEHKSTYVVLSRTKFYIQNAILCTKHLYSL